MISRKILFRKVNIYIKHVCFFPLHNSNSVHVLNYSGVTKCTYQKLFSNLHTSRETKKCLLPHQLTRKCSLGTLDDIENRLQSSNEENELKKITDLFPHPRVTLKEFQEKTPEKVFDMHYKQNVITPKGARKAKKAVQNDWICCYSFIWPEKVKFEGTAISKRLAAEKAAIQALHYLYTTKRIDIKGHPIYKREVINKLKNSMNEPIRVEISEKSMERIENVWDDYLDGIKNIYETTFKEAKHKITPLPSTFTKDSTIDEEDEFAEVDNSLEKNVEDLSDLKIRIHPVYGKTIQTPSKSTLERRNRVLNQKFERYDEHLLPLPIDQYVAQITSTVQTNPVTIIVGAAGCGKSTRAPAAILRELGAKTTAIVSEPRRVAAIGLAERVANEMGEEVGDSIGYQVRLHAKPPRPPAGSVLYCTSGVLLRRLQANPGLEGCSHVFIDEAHERDVNTDLTLLLLKRALDLNPDLKVIVMSATLDIGVFTRYFDSCPVVEVPGRTFPVHVSYLDDIQKRFKLRLSHTQENCQKVDGKPVVNCQEVVQVIQAIDKNEPDGAILVFLPGWAEIKQAKILLDQCYGNDSLHLIIPVHSRLSTADQTKMFARPLPGVRKIVLATNIAETSITIPDVVYVVDTGAHKENRIREGTGTASLETVWVSQAGARQRAGRAGRVQAGNCYRLYTKEKEDEFAPHTTPEILRIPLEQTVLDCKSYAPEESIEQFLSQLPEPPSNRAIQFAVNDLIDLGALTRSEQVTRLGSLLSTLSLHPRLGRAVLNAAVIGNVLSMANTVTHCSDNVELFVNASDRRDEIREIKRKFHPSSDHASLHCIQDGFERTLEEDRGSVEEWCSGYGLRRDRLNYVRSISNLHLEQLLKSGLLEPTVEPSDLTRYSDVDELTAAVLLSGADCLMRARRSVRVKGKLATTTGLVTSAGDRAHIGTESVNHGITKRSTNSILVYFGGYHSTERRALVVYKTSLVPPHTALLFCKEELTMNNVDDETIALSLPKHKLQIHVPKNQADHIVKAKEMLWNTFQYYVERDLKTLDYDENSRISRFKTRLVKAIGRLLIEADRQYVQGKDRNQNNKMLEE